MTVSGIATLVKQAVDIVDVIGRVVPLRRSGKRHVGLCPFHQEKTPSFQVDAENQLYYCFGCGKGGDVLRFVMEHQNLAFADAVQFLAERYNIPLPRTDHTVSDDLIEASRKERERILAAIQCAADFFCSQLHFSSEGRVARDYILKRGLPSGVVESQKLGYAPAKWDALYEHLKKNGIGPDLAVKAGLLTQSANDSSKCFDRFRNRLIFPIKDERDRIVAFGGRSLSQEEKNEPKYLNSPETPVYHKGRTLYQYGVARESCRQVRQVLLVEGYMDLLAFHAKEFYRVVATLGTALTSHQVRLLARISDEVVLAYDGDDAGEKAMLRALPLFLQEELSVSCVCFPDGMDPDDFLGKHELAELEQLVAHREELGAYAVRKALSLWDGTAAGRAKIFTELQPVCGVVKQPLLRAEYLRLIADRFSITEELAEAQIRHDKGGETGKPQRRSAAANRPKAPEIECLEEKVLRLIIKYPGLIECVRGSNALSCFRESKLAAIAAVLCDSEKCSLVDFESSKIYDLLGEQDLQDLYARYLLEPYELHEPEIQLRDWLNDLVVREEKLKRKELERSLQEAEKKGDFELMRSLLVRIRDLRTKTNVSGFSG